MMTNVANNALMVTQFIILLLFIPKVPTEGLFTLLILNQ